MRDPKDSIVLFGIYEIDHSVMDPDVKEELFSDNIRHSWNWIDRFDESNKRTEDVLPCLTCNLLFENAPEKILSFIVSQPNKYFLDKKFDKKDSDNLIASILINLSVIAEDRDNGVCKDLVDRFKNLGHYRYMIYESYCYHAVKNGQLVPFFNHEPYWKEKNYMKGNDDDRHS